MNGRKRSLVSTEYASYSFMDIYEYRGYCFSDVLYMIGKIHIFLSIAEKMNYKNLKIFDLCNKEQKLKHSCNIKYAFDTLYENAGIVTQDSYKSLLLSNEYQEDDDFENMCEIVEEQRAKYLSLNDTYLDYVLECLKESSLFHSIEEYCLCPTGCSYRGKEICTDDKHNLNLATVISDKYSIPMHYLKGITYEFSLYSEDSLGYAVMSSSILYDYHSFFLEQSVLPEHIWLKKVIDDIIYKEFAKYSSYCFPREVPGRLIFVRENKTAYFILPLYYDEVDCEGSITSLGFNYGLPSYSVILSDMLKKLNSVYHFSKKP